MADMSQLQGKTDLVTGLIASTAIPSPWWMTALDGTSKAIGIIYAILGAIWLYKQIMKPGEGRRE